MNASQEMEGYFSEIDNKVKDCYKISTEARKKGYDPEEKVDIPLAKNMAERVEGLISVVAPQLVGTRMTKRIQELENEYKLLDWRVGFKIAEEVASEKFCKFSSKKEAMEVGIRVGFAYLTGGIVAAPLEGFIELKIKKRRDGKEYFSVLYAGPVRGAGGTAAATSVVLADYIRKKMGYAPYDATEDEVNRYISEIIDYHERIANLQYFPTEAEIKFLAEHLPVEINGEPTEKIEVSNYKDLPRVETNKIRGGICLVMAEGLAQKAQKIWKRLSKWGKDLDLDWGFLEEFLKLQKEIKAKSTEEKTQAKLTPNYTYINDLVAGRPILTYPLRMGGFRLRYGRSRISGFSAASIHPALMHLLNNYIATGTQLKVERPGKAAAITPCSAIEGPIVKLTDGSVIAITKESDAKKLACQVEKILFLGDIMFSYGDFSENGHFLAPPGYNEEWYVQELEKATVGVFGNIDLDKLAELVNIQKEDLEHLFKDPHDAKISARAAFNISQKLKTPLHPCYTYHWKNTNAEDIVSLLAWIEKSDIKIEDNQIKKIILQMGEQKHVLELIGVPHIVVNKEFVVIQKNHAFTLVNLFGISDKKDITALKTRIADNKEKSALEIVNMFSSVKVRDKSGTFIGARMGRPEKAKMRKLTGSPQVLFPVGSEGGRLRSFQSALEAGKVTADLPAYECKKCKKETIYPVCETCGRKTKRMFFCKECGTLEKQICPHGKTHTYKRQQINIKHYFDTTIKMLGVELCPDLIKGVRGTSNKDHTPENLAKGILRAKHDIYVNKDGTTRYDMTELPMTHFKPKEIRTSVAKLKELGYTHDIKGKPLENSEQVVELKPQDIILPSNMNALDESSDKVLFKVANFVDELLVKFYGLKSFYNLKSPDNLVGHVVVGLAPHISAGMVGRIAGFSETQGCFAHPLWHAALRRDCDGDECCVTLAMDAFLNFSRQYLPDMRGSRTMDSPLVLTSRLIPAEVDDMVHGLDVVWGYPLEFYEAAMESKNPWDIHIEQLGSRLNTEKQYEKIGYTQNVSDINTGVLCSAYKTLPSMEDKLRGQMEIAEKIVAVDTSDVARLVIEKHFLKDIKGNLRKFSQQQFRCVKCNEKYRRPPLAGKCLECGGRIIFTISEGSVVKYLEPSISLANKYDVPVYLKQTLELTKRRIDDYFGKEKEKQEGLGKWFG